MNKPAPLISKSPFTGGASEQYSALWEAILHTARDAGYPDYGLSGSAKEKRAAEAFLRHTSVVQATTSVSDMLNRLGYKIVKVTE